MASAKAEGLVADRAAVAVVSEQIGCADTRARTLAPGSCRFAFSIPGGEALTPVDALEDAGVRFVLVLRENAGGFMAKGAHHATGAPAVRVATAAPRVAYAVNVVANAYQDRVPMVF